MLDYSGIYPQIWDAVEHQDGEKGCLFSHKEVLRDIIIQNYTWSLVFEDDVDFDVSLVQQLDKLKSDLITPEMHMVYLGVFNEVGIERLHKSDRTILVESKRPSGAFAYMLTQTGASEFLALLNKIGDDNPVDKWFSGGKLSSWNVFPQLVTGIPSMKSDLRDDDGVREWQTKNQPKFENSCYQKILSSESNRRNRKAKSSSSETSEKVRRTS